MPNGFSLRSSVYVTPCTSNTNSKSSAPNFEKPQDANADNDYVVNPERADPVKNNTITHLSHTTSLKAGYLDDEFIEESQDAVNRRHMEQLLLTSLTLCLCTGGC